MSDSDDGKARLLQILESHGQSFLSSFAMPASTKALGKRKKEDTNTSCPKRQRTDDTPAYSDEEWQGITKDISSKTRFESEEEDEVSSGSDFEHTDKEIVDEHESNVVVFSEPGHKRGFQGDISKAQMKAFMSSKVSKMTSNAEVGATKKTSEEEEDRTNAQNDALLHKLVHTKLLSGSLTSELYMTPAQRRKALAGRVLELSGGAKLGKGEKHVRDSEKNKAAKRVREGISQKQKKNQLQELEQAKNLGNYHPALKKLYEASNLGSSTRRREKGMKMGVGKFSNGALRLGRDDLKLLGGSQSETSSKGRNGRGGPRKKK